MSLRSDGQPKLDDPLWPMGATVRISWAVGLRAFPAIAALFRALPIVRVGRLAVVSRHDDVREVFLTDVAFEVTYRKRLRDITGGHPFILDMPDSAEYRQGLAALRSLIRLGDPEEIGAAAEEVIRRGLPETSGEVEVVSLLRTATFEAVARWLGVPEPAGGPALAVSATRLFGYQFGGGGTAPETEAKGLAAALRHHIAEEMRRRREAGSLTQTDVLGRAMARQAEGHQWFTDEAILTGVLCLLVGGPPQPPIVAPNALDQLLRRPQVLARAHTAARAGDGDSLRLLVREAMRFDPLAPALERTATRDHVLAAGTGRDRCLPKGTKVLLAFASAMRDGRRIESPGRFDASRPDAAYIHFGLGLHECFGREVNAALLHRLLAPLLRLPDLRRAPGRNGQLVKRGVYPESMKVAFGAPG